MTASDSPCLYSSTNPWKVTSEFKAVSHTREEYVKVIEELKAKAPTKTKRLAKFEISHINLIQALENRLEAIDTELAVSDALQIYVYLFDRPLHCSIFPARSLFYTIVCFYSACRKFAGKSSREKSSRFKQSSAPLGLGGKHVDLIMFIIKT